MTLHYLRYKDIPEDPNYTDNPDGVTCVDCGELVEVPPPAWKKHSARCGECQKERDITLREDVGSDLEFEADDYDDFEPDYDDSDNLD